MDVQPRFPERWEARVDLAAACHRKARLRNRQTIANHFSLSVNREGTRFLNDPKVMFGEEERGHAN